MAAPTRSVTRRCIASASSIVVGRNASGMRLPGVPRMRANLDDPAGALKAARSLPRIAKLDDVLANSDEGTRNPGRPWLLAPCDLQAIKAAGVTFVASMLE